MSDMCKGMEELTQEYYQNGMERGMERGLERGKQQGCKDTIVMLVQDGLLEIAVAAEKLGISESEFMKLL